MRIPSMFKSLLLAGCFAVLWATPDAKADPTPGLPVILAHTTGSSYFRPVLTDITVGSQEQAVFEDHARLNDGATYYSVTIRLKNDQVLVVERSAVVHRYKTGSKTSSNEIEYEFPIKTLVREEIQLQPDLCVTLTRQGATAPPEQTKPAPR